MRTVTADGSPTADGITAPCNLTRAVQLANSGTVDQMFEVLPGKYVQLPLELKSNGAKFLFQPGAVLTGARVHAKGPWTQVSERVWSTPYTIPVNLVVQLGNWKVILVDDHAPDGTSLGRPYTLYEPVKLKWVDSVAKVQAQYGTWTAISGNLYVHMYSSSEPREDDLLHLGTKGWGTLTITGNENEIYGLTIYNTNGVGLTVRPSARANILSNIKTVDSQVWLEGIETKVSGLDISHVISQGEPGRSGCWSANNGFGECWNAYGDGRGLLIGRENTQTVYNQTITDAYVHRCWNGARIDGPNYIARSTFWGFANHTLEASGKGVQIKNCIFNWGQDSLFVRAAIMGGWVIEDNMFHHGIYLVTTTSPIGVATEWQFNRNVVNALTTDYRTHRTMKSQRNVRIDNSGNAYRVIDTAGERGFTAWDIPNQ